MFDFAWSEIALIGIVALVLIGPKDLPVAIKAVAGMVKKARRMAGEFQVHVDEMVREADLHEVRREFNDLRRMDIKGKILNALDDDGSLRKTMSENPLDAPLTTPPPLTEVAVPPVVGLGVDGAMSHGDAAAPVGEAGSLPALEAVAHEGAPVAASLGPAAHTADMAAAPVSPGVAAVPADAAVALAPAMIPPAMIPPAMIPPVMIPPADAKHPPQHA